MEDLKVKHICEICDGTGSIDLDGTPGSCSHCGGDGYQAEAVLIDSGDLLDTINDIKDKVDDIMEKLNE